MSSLTARLLAHLPYDAIIARRRRNYHRLLEILGDERHSATGALQPGTCPLFLPLRVHDRNTALETLWGAGVEAIDLWRWGDPSLPRGAFPIVDEVRRTVIEVPIHQDLDDGAVDLVARACKLAVRHGR